MRVFVTGATGFVGFAVVQELMKAGHEVVGLVRSDGSAKKLAEVGAKIHRGDLTDLGSLQKGAGEADGVIHTGFIHDFSKFKENSEIDRRAIEAMGATLAGSRRPLVITSAIGILPAGKLVTEETMPPSPSPNPRTASEEAAHALLDRGINISVVRLPPATHGEGDHAFVPTLIKIAREKGASAYISKGANHWPAVHRLDAAQVFRLALEKGTQGNHYHAVAEEGVALRAIAEAIGKGLNVPFISIKPEEASAHFAWFSHFASMNVLASSKWTQEKLTWTPTQVGLIEDIERSNYFKV
jgi:nucleoside-diphosphate-sugar epimerase